MSAMRQALSDLYALLKDHATVPDDRYHLVTNAAALLAGANCQHEAYQGRCVHCDAPFVGGLVAVPAHTGAADRRMYVTCHQCEDCQHIGINDAHETNAACNSCGWCGPSPDEDHCPGCDQNGTMCEACPKCSGRYVLLADADLVPPALERLG